jgi:serine phosphatase RsbU (regulator of sigma subunit)
VTERPEASGLSASQEAWAAWVEDRLGALQRVSLELTAAVSIDDVVATVLDVLDAPVAAPSRSLWLRDDVTDTLVLLAHRGMPDEAAAKFGRIPLSADVPGAVAARERRTIVSGAHADAVAEYATLQNVPRSTSGFAAIPLVADQRSVGVLGIGVDDVLDERDLAFFEAVAAQVAQTITRVRLTERERRRRTELEFLATLTDTALRASDHLDLMREVCAAAVPTLGDWCSLYFLPESGGPPLVTSAHVDPAKAAYVKTLQERHPYDPDGTSGVPAVVRSGSTEFVPKLTSAVIDDAIASAKISVNEATAIIDHLGITSAITVPLRTKRRIVGAMQVISAESGRHYDEDDVALAEAVAGRLAEALDSAWIADHQRTIAVTLQQALLPPALPTIPGVEVAARYWPAGMDRVGGDFYDVFQLGGGRWALVIGDVCGTGPNAAALTSVARHTIRAAARHGADAAAVMSWLNEAVLLSSRDLFCTACYATLTSDEGRWHLSSTAAGHPLPIVASREVTKTIGQAGTLLGVVDEVAVSTGEATLAPGDVVVFYTDGITDLPPPHGVLPDAVRDLVFELRDRTSADDIAEAIRRSLVERVPDRSRRDDVALLVIRIL